MMRMQSMAALPRRFWNPRPWACFATPALLGSVAGCAFFNPYDHQPLPTPLPPGENIRFAGGAQQALQEADEARFMYYKDLKFSAVARNTSAVAAAALSAKALYTALKPNAGTDGDKRMLARTGVALGALYGLRQFFVNGEQEAAYIEGYTAITCLMLESAALLMTERDDKAPAAKPVDWSTGNDVVSAVVQRQPGETDIEFLRGSLDRLEKELAHFYGEVVEAKARADVIAGGDQGLRESQGVLRGSIGEAERALDYARHTLNDGRMLLAAVQHSGQGIRQRVGVVMANVNAMVQDRQHEFGTAGSNLKDAYGIASGILNIGNTTAADQTSVHDESTKTSSLGPRDILLAGPMSAAGPLLAAAPAPAAPRAKAAARADAKGQAVVPSIDQLTAMRDLFDAAVKDLQKQEATRQQKQALVDLEQQQAALATKIDAMVRGAAYCVPVGSAAPSPNLANCSLTLARDTERLYARRLPVAQALLGFRKAVRDAVATPACRALAPLRVSPNDASRLYAGESRTFVISQRGTGNPFASLDGPIDADKGLSIEYKPLSGSTAYEVKVSVSPKMDYSRVVQLSVSDAKGLSNQLIPILAGGPAPRGAKADPPAPKAAASATSVPEATAKG